MIQIGKAAASIQKLTHEVEVQIGVITEVLVRTIALRALWDKHIALHTTAQRGIIVSIVFHLLCTNGQGQECNSWKQMFLFHIVEVAIFYLMSSLTFSMSSASAPSV